MANEPWKPGSSLGSKLCQFPKGHQLLRAPLFAKALHALGRRKILHPEPNGELKERTRFEALALRLWQWALCEPEHSWQVPLIMNSQLQLLRRLDPVPKDDKPAVNVVVANDQQVQLANSVMQAPSGERGSALIAILKQHGFLDADGTNGKQSLPSTQADTQTQQ